MNIASEVSKEVNYAAANTKLQIIMGDICISDAPAGEYVLKIYSVPEFLYEYKTNVVIGEDGNANISFPNLKINDSFYRSELIEAKDGEIKVELFSEENPDVILGFCNTDIHIQGYMHWDAHKYPESLAVFSQPNDSGVIEINKEAGGFAAGKGETMCGYQCRTKEGIIRQVGYIYDALKTKNISYINPPASFEQVGQKLRTPHLVMHENSKQGTCIDLAILMASAIEAAGMNAMIVLIPGHAFAAAWLEDKSFIKPIVNRSEFSDEMWNSSIEDIIPIECTSFVAGRDIDFESAVNSARHSMESTLYIVDFAAARKANLNPVYTFTDKPICNLVDDGSKLLQEKYDSKNLTMLDVFREQAMDITARNVLLNINKESVNKNSISFEIDVVDFLNNKNHSIMDDIKKKYKTTTKLKTLDTVLRDAYKKSMHNMREKGKDDLYIALNEIKWKDVKSGKTYDAVMYLIPIEVYKNKRGDFQLRITDDNIIVNPALKVFLSQIHGFDASDLDFNKKSYSEQMKFIRFLIENKSGWTITENVAHIGHFKLPNEAIWNDLNNEKVIHHDIVEGLLCGAMTWDNELAGDESSQDDISIYPFDSDGSQNAILKSLSDIRTQCIAGPAGNGKTQTIANIILKKILEGKSVLFVSEKTTAIDVIEEKVNSKLEGKFNARIESNKNSAKNFVSKINNTIFSSNNIYNDNVSHSINEKRKRFSEDMKYIEKYYNFMCERDEISGKNLEDIINMFEKVVACPIVYECPEELLDKDFEELIDDINLFADVYVSNRNPVGVYSKYVSYESLENAKNESNAILKVNKAIEKYDALEERLAAFRELCNLPEISNSRKLFADTYRLVLKLKDCPVKNADNINVVDIESSRKEAEKFKTELKNELKLYKNMSKLPLLAAPQKDKCLGLLVKLFGDAGKASSILRDITNSFDEVCKEIDSYDVIAVNGKYTIDHSKSDKEAINRFYDDMANDFAGYDNNWHNTVENIINDIFSGRNKNVKALAADISNLCKEYTSAFIAARDVVIKNKEAFDVEFPDVHPMEIIKDWNDKKDLDVAHLKKVYDSKVNMLNKKGYKSIIDTIEEIDGAENGIIVNKKVIVDSFIRSWARAMYEKKNVYNGEQFDYHTFNNHVKRMTDREKEIRDLLAKEIIAAQFDRMPNPEKGEANNEELGRLKRLVKKSKNVTLRDIFEQAPNAVKTVLPCLFMDPMAVAENIPVDFPPFDLVIIDEGSQMPTYEALIPISRGKSLIIFGDEKQLQPESRFKKNVLDEYEDVVEVESILTTASITSMPEKYLRFHYRSEDDSLVAFSNYKYYDNSMITFPSSDTSVSAVSYEYVEGVYDKKESKANAEEAERVIEKISEILSDNKKETIGVVTFNIHQRDFIKKLFNDRVMLDREFGTSADELVDIVNLESCQGMEWDHVIIAPGFGKDKDGKFTMNFGALNTSDGSRRLNVMLTRARKKLYVITSIEPHMIKDESAEGIQDFKEFLKYASGQLKLDNRVVSKENREPGIIDNVARELERAGYTVHTNIGSSNFKIDIGVVSKDNPNKYVAGIILDHCSDRGTSIYDKELTFKKSLEYKDWKIYRLREINWVTDKKTEISQIKELINN